MIEIATILTCFNRREKTTASLQQLLAARDDYNRRNPDDAVALSIYLTDDGCTDGTAEAVREVCKAEELHIIQGDGNCYWAGGMRLAWREALKEKQRWDYYLLMNDDTFVMNNVFDEFRTAENYCKKTYGKVGVYSGVTCDTADNTRITYSGDVFTSRFMGKLRRVTPNGTPQMVDMTNANILLVPVEVVEKIGIFDDGYQHSNADFDYTSQARKNGFPALITANVCGTCDYDHYVNGAEEQKLAGMTLKERKAYLAHPLHSDAEYLYYIRRNVTARYPVSWILRKIRLYFPQIYLSINKARKVY